MQSTIRNDTPSFLQIDGVEGRRITLSPLEQRRLDSVAGFDFSEAEREGTLSHWREPPRGIVETAIGTAFASGVMIVIVCAALSGDPKGGMSHDAWNRLIWISGAALLVAIVGGVVIYQTRSFHLVLRFIVQGLSLLAILGIGLGLPVATVNFFCDGKTLLAGNSPELFARMLQVAFIATASLLPALLFFLFDRFQLSTVRQRLYRDLFRLDRTLKTRAEIDARYGSQIREAFGPEEDGRGRLAPGTRWPVLLCAFVITLGWLMALRPIGKIEPAALANPLGATPSAWTFGFLGAYFFGLQLIARRYARGELKPKVYGYVTVRILTVAVLSWVLEILFGADSTLKLVLAFLTGILPDEFFTLLRERFRGRRTAKLVPEPEKHPLTRLEGIDLYDRARLEQEGIVNVEGLAHHDLIQLVLEASVPVPRLVDWMDQAILYLHVVQDSDSSAHQTLRQYGIRTATDLLTCWNAAEARHEVDQFKKLLGGDGPPFRLEVIRDTLRDDEWLNRVQDWRKDAPPGDVLVNATLRSLKARLEWADTLANEGRLKDAVRVLERTLEAYDSARAHVRLARLLADAPKEERDIARCRVHARRALERAQADIEVLETLIDVFEALQEWTDAIHACDAFETAIGEPGSDRTKQQMLKILNTRRGVLKLKEADAVESAIAAAKQNLVVKVVELAPAKVAGP
jgi:hypothetical protein